MTDSNLPNLGDVSEKSLVVRGSHARGGAKTEAAIAPADALLEPPAGALQKQYVRTIVQNRPKVCLVRLRAGNRRAADCHRARKDGSCRTGAAATRCEPAREIRKRHSYSPMVPSHLSWVEATARGSEASVTYFTPAEKNIAGMPFCGIGGRRGAEKTFRPGINPRPGRSEARVPRARERASVHRAGG